MGRVDRRAFPLAELMVSGNVRPSTRPVMETGHLSTRAINSGSGNRALMSHQTLATSPRLQNSIWVQEVGVDKVRDGLTKSKRKWYTTGSWGCYKTKSNGRNSFMQHIVQNLRVKMDGLKERKWLTGEYKYFDYRNNTNAQKTEVPHRVLCTLIN